MTLASPKHNKIANSTGLVTEQVYLSLKVEFDTAVNVHSISIYETYHAGAVVKVSLRDPDGIWVPVWTGDAEEIEESRIFQPPLQVHVNTLTPRQNERHFADDIFKCILLNENVCITTKNSLKFVPKGPINNIPALVQIMAWRRPGDKPLSEPMLVCLPTHICVTRPQWVNTIPIKRYPMNSLAPGRCCSNVESKISEHLWRALFRRLTCK